MVKIRIFTELGAIYYSHCPAWIGRFPFEKKAG